MPAWRIEEAAALVAGFVPRTGLELDFRPDAGEEKEPIQARKTRGPEWADLLARNGSVGRVISAYARSRHVRNWEFPEHELFIEPGKFLEWCSKSGIAIPSKLQAAVKLPGRRTSALVRKRAAAKRRRQTETAKRKATYKARTQQIAQKLCAAGARVSAFDLQTLVQHTGKTDRTVAASSFQNYLAEWKGGRSTLAQTLNGALFKEPGRPTEEQRTEQRRAMPREYADILWSGSQRKRKTHK